MPCHDGGGYDPPSAHQIRREIEREFLHNSPLAEMLCEFCKQLEANGMPMPPQIASWWKEHKRRDEAKAATERNAKKLAEDKMNALNKLTQYERDLLGLKPWK